MNANTGPSLPLLAVISGVASFCMALIVPALPMIEILLQTNAAGAQFLVSGYLLGLAFSQPLWGPVADLFGRRGTALVGLGFFLASSVACAVVESLEALVIMRVFQGAGASVGTVVARAMVRDCYSVEDSAHAMSWIAVGQGTAPIIAPIIGGIMVARGSVDGLFYSVIALGCVLWGFVYRRLPETLPADSPTTSWVQVFRGFGTLLSHGGFLGYTAVFGFIQGGFFSFLAVGAAVFADSFDIGPSRFGTLWGVMGFSYVIGAIVTGRLSSSRRRPLLLPIGIVGTLLCSALILLCQLAFGTTLLGIAVPLVLLMTLAGGVTPLVMAGAIYQVPHLAGTAAGLSSAIGMTVGGAFTVVAGVLYAGDFTPVAILVCGAGSATFLSWLTVRKR